LDWTIGVWDKIVLIIILITTIISVVNRTPLPLSLSGVLFALFVAGGGSVATAEHRLLMEETE
jgi:hypothetical protein